MIRITLPAMIQIAIGTSEKTLPGAMNSPALKLAHSDSREFGGCLQQKGSSGGESDDRCLC